MNECGGWSDQLEQHPPDERRNSKILPWSSIAELRMRLEELGLVESVETTKRTT